MSIKPNIFSYATGELSQDAFICWLVSHLDYREDLALHGCAKKFIALLYNLESTSDSIEDIDVKGFATPPESRERYPWRQYHKIDVYFRVEIKGKSVSFIIEDKTHTSHHSDQLLKYKLLVEEEFPEDEIVCIYYKTGYLFPEDYEATNPEHGGYAILSCKEIDNFLQSHPMPNIIFESYKEHIHRLYDHRVNNAEKWKDGDISCFEFDFAQWEFMKALTEKCEIYLCSTQIDNAEEVKTRIYRDQNSSGTCWTQMWFIKFGELYAEEEHGTESVFYRLDKKGNDDYYLSLRQYARIPDNSKEQKKIRLGLYKKLFKEAIGDTPISFEEPGNRGIFENEIAILFFKDNSPKKVLEHMGAIHQRFLRAVLNSDLILKWPDIKMAEFKK